ncbi:DUF6484 domain-containing protein [Teredinibacter sp. KSP-S5-2]|uniref:DUF6484 domain-containing protein n=1 Tax=Teredinibacter sp. KSP-S5-2 TaxID=3034506 RepID=UPI002934C3FB|nr:DUF6484 domain-containing protein [Teredinibacter sp. KSP-S5-2]WNO08091.1 DUF6484 domain-containing protein [Teredinibacter sp. KSP-S5-2]
MSVIKTLKPLKGNLLVESAVQTVIASLVGVNEEGRPLVSIGDAPEVVARSALSLSECEEVTSFPVQVIVAIESAEPAQPIITGLVRDTLFPVPGQKKSKEKYKAVVDGETVTLSAKEEIKLECGKSSILLRKDGKVIIKGVNLVSRSLATNKIKGSSVSIN